VADVQRAVRVGGHELDRHRLARIRLLAAEVGALLEDAADGRQPAGLRDLEVDEARAGDLHLRHVLGLAEIGDQLLRQLARRQAGGLGQQQGDVRGVVAVLARLGALDHVVGRDQVLGQLAVPAQVQQGLGHEFAQMLFHGRGNSGDSRRL
jgi:hypothetical protein